MSTKSVEPVGSRGLWKAGLHGRFSLLRNACTSSIFPQFAGPGDKQEFLFKGNLESHFKDTCHFLPVSSQKTPMNVSMNGMTLAEGLKAGKTAQSPEAGCATSPCFPSWLSDAQSWTVREMHVRSRCGLDALKRWLQHLSYVAHANSLLLSCSSSGKIRFYIRRPTLFLNFKDLLFTSTFKGKIFKGLFICYKSVPF